MEDCPWYKKACKFNNHKKKTSFDICACCQGDPQAAYDKVYSISKR